MPSVDLLHFFSGNPIDKIVDSGQQTIVNDGETGGDWQQAKIVTASTAHTYTRTPLIRAVWTIDGGTNWQGLDAKIQYEYDLIDGGSVVGTLANLDSAVSVGANSSTVFFRTANGKHGNITDMSGAQNYTPQSRTFTIKWWAYERA